MPDKQNDYTKLYVDDKEIILIGTAHISQESVDTVIGTIDEYLPDAVCVELDHQRYQALINQKGWENLDLKDVIKKKQLPFLLANLALSSYQKRMGLQTGVKPGAELAAAAQTAEERGMEVELVDRNIRTTLLRVWRKTGLWNKMKVMAALLGSIFEKQELDEAELAKLRESDTLSSMLDEMGKLLPSVKQILVDERDEHMAFCIRNAPGEKVLAVVGAAHLPGIVRHLQGEEIEPERIEEITTIPEKTAVSKMIPWLIPSIVIVLFIGGFFFGNRDQLADVATAWVLANGLLSAIGALIAWGHPITIISAFVAAPLTSLNPTIGAGFVTGFVQAIVAPPTVRDMEHVGDDLVTLKGWWHNRLARVLLVFLFSSIGSALGTFVALGWLKNLF
ncbi:pheromone shutdown-related protein TraB [Malonomonas rubra DSM 5091]|uniref:Pheromone shutdown-related protein TraB n=1 Tax=Malonomonas rubra DSM 5091 TaxID=1122189 RepID=A0A1M6CJS2_MALRU|nr:TraB/GumN family protein [Malonomonas rubra]SHI61173.1 pheromone shutdown-related protein TraB [Malonomonas rubra DSM 5091]